MSETTRAARARPAAYAVGDLRVDLRRGSVHREDGVHRLNGQPLAILEALIDSPSRSLGREELQELLWPDEPFGDLDQRLNAAVRLLRRALGDSSEAPRYLETLRGRGYRICADVEPVDDMEAVGSGETVHAVAAAADAAAGTESLERVPDVGVRGVPRSVRRGGAVLAAAVLVVLVATLSGGSALIDREQPGTGVSEQAEPEGLDQGLLVPGTTTGPAYQAYLSAMRTANEGDLATAQQHAEAAIALDPKYAAAQVLLGRIHRASGDPERAERAYRRAIDLDTGFADAHLSLGNVQFWNQWKWAEAEESFRIARELAPGRVEVHHSVAWFLLASRRFEEAAAAMEEALELDPMSAVLHSDFGWFQYRMRNYPAALSTCHAALDLEPTLRSALDCRHRTYARLGDYGRALESAIDSLQLPASVERRLRGLPVAVAYRDLLVYLDGSQTESNRFVRAMNLAAAGRVDEAIHQLEVAAMERNSLLVLIDVTPEFDLLVADERFQRVRRTVKSTRPHHGPVGVTSNRRRAEGRADALANPGWRETADHSSTGCRVASPSSSDRAPKTKRW